MIASRPAPLHELQLRERSQIGGRPQKDPRSPEWAYQAVAYLKDKWRHIDIDHERFLAMVVEIVRNKSWTVIPTNAPYGSLSALLQAELETPIDEIRKRVKIAESGILEDERQSLTVEISAANPVLGGGDLAVARAAGGKKSMPGPGRGNKTLPRLPEKGFKRLKPGHETNDYLLRRLARIDADTGSTWICRYQAGEFPSVAATGRAAGIPIGRNVKLGKPQTVAATLVRLMGPDYVSDVIIELRRLLDE